MSSSPSSSYSIFLTGFADAASPQPASASHFDTAAQFGAFWQRNDHFHEVLRPEDAPHFGLCQLKPGHAWHRDNIECVTAIVLDILSFCDQEEGLGDILARLPGCHVAFARFESTPGAPCWRLVVALAEAVTVEDFEGCQLPLALAKKLNVVIDPACLRADTLYAFPALPQGFFSAPRLDSPYLFFLCDDEPVLSLADLDDVEDGDAEAYLPQAPRPASAPQAPQLARHPVYDELGAYVQQHQRGVAPIWTKGGLYVFNGIVWQPMSPQALVRDLMVEVFQEQRSPQQVTQFAHALRQRYFQDVFPAAQLGSSGYRIALANGTVDPLRAQQVPNDPAYYLRSQLPFAFDPKASCMRWQLFLREIFADDKDRLPKTLFLQEMMGYLLIPSTHHHVMFWLYGGGSNGKSVVLKIITWLLGSHNVSTVPLTKLGHRFYLAQLDGKLANLSDEMGANAVLDDEVLKQTISGGRQQAERKGEHPYEFEPYARIVASTNTLPRTVDKSFGFFRRVRILRFTRTFTAGQQDLLLPAKLQRELPGIFNWALQGLQRLEQQGEFTVVPSSLEVQEGYEASCDPVRAFVKECLTAPTPGTAVKSSKTLTGTVFHAYQRFCEDRSYPSLDDSYFGRALAELGFTVKRSNGQRFYPVILRDPDGAVSP